MAAYELILKQPMRIDNETYYPGISVQISVPHNQPLYEQQKISDAFWRVHGIKGMREKGYVNQAYLDVVQIG